MPSCFRWLLIRSLLGESQRLAFVTPLIKQQLARPGERRQPAFVALARKRASHA